MSRTVFLTDGAARDLDELYAAAYDAGGASSADLLLDRIQVALQRLAGDAPVGEPLEALRRLGLHEGRQLRDDPLRYLYRVQGGEVHLIALCDRRRSLQSLLQRRMLDS